MVAQQVLKRSELATVGSAREKLRKLWRARRELQRLHRRRSLRQHQGIWHLWIPRRRTGSSLQQHLEASIRMWLPRLLSVDGISREMMRPGELRAVPLLLGRMSGRS